MSFKDNFLQTADDIQLTKIIFPGKVFDANDPKRLGRLRVLPSQDMSYSKIIQSIPGWNESKDAWTNKDPILFLPLLPFYIYQTPIKDEYVHILYYDKNYKDGNRFYIQGPFSDPRQLVFEDFTSMQQQLSSGNEYSQSDNITNYNKSKGIFPEPGDNGLMGRGTTDLILKQEEVLIRAGKTKISELKRGIAPSQNEFRSFLQLSNFTKTIEEGELEESIRFVEVIKVVKKMIIWNVDNLENNNNQFNGSIGIYNVIPNTPLVNSQNFRLETIQNISIGTNYQGPIEEFVFKNKSISEIHTLTNQIIQSLFTGKVQIPGYGINSSSNFKPDQVFPFVVTPSKITYQQGGSFTGQTENQISKDIRKHYKEIYDGIKVNEDTRVRGFILVSENRSGKAATGPIYETVVEENASLIFSNKPTTYGVMGAEKLYLLSHKITDAPKGQIDLKDTLYGIPAERFIGEGGIESKTYPMVRGDQLIELLRKIMSYIKGHVHPISTMSPVPIAAGNGQSTEEIDEILSNAEISILNQNIRIN